MTIFLFKGSTRNLEFRNTPVWVLLNISRMGQTRDTKFGNNVSIEMLMNVAKFQSYSVYHSLLPKPPQLHPPPFNQIRVNIKVES